MNKISGYKEFVLESGQVVRVKFCNGTNEIYAKLRGFTNMQQVQESLMLPMVAGVDEEGKPIQVPDYTVDFLESVRLYFYAGCKYVALAEGREIDFNEWTVNEWLEEIGQVSLFSAIEPASDTMIQEAADAKKKPKKKAPLIRASQ